MNLKPLSNHVIVKALPAEEVSASGIILPDSQKEDRPEQGEVVAVGPGKMLESGSRETMEVSVGQKILFKRYAPDPVTIDKEEYFVLRSDDVVAIIQ